MPTEMISSAEEELVDRLVEHYKKNFGVIRRFLESIHAQIADALTEAEPLSELVHSVKRRMKDPSHLKDKLIRKLLEKKKLGEDFDITEDNLLVRINDLAGYRILHLHTQQMGDSLYDLASRMVNLLTQMLKQKKPPLSRRGF